ncbi:hypothetical protein GCM10011390_16890 [Aureimonas endophytica]|uniref:Diguanylate cyclase (GGDEF)-like protein n=1 Tax=Aureimonas endophytica TaxID=2027858 RepID=A0A917E2J3_9HYPH|nr:bifunctional diguanylate cyclase/phosphodiesterase [Aureimonas endophytica]GGD98736.1 hypothetical protein GCM10011390_16890 [Aureimonas endophytica]
MPQREDRWEIPLLVLTAGLGLAAIWMLFASVHYMQRISRSAENNVVYEVLTTAPELARLQAALAQRFLPGSQVGDDDVALRFQILQNRTDLLANRESSRVRGDTPEALLLIDQIRRVVAEVTPRMEALRSAGDATAVLHAFEPLNAKAARLAALTTSATADRIATNEGKLRDIFWLLLLEIAGLLACGLTLVTLLRRARRRSRDLAEKDTLTGLASRLSFNAVLATEFERRRGPGRLAVLMFDLDHFKHVNDTLGHAAGDRLLVAVAERLRPALADAALFARLSGDEFAAIFLSDGAEGEAERAAIRILDAFVPPFEILGTTISASASIGVAALEGGEGQPEELLKNADLALYDVKANGRSGLRLCHAELKRGYLARQTLAADLEHALRREELGLAFQPILALETLETRGFEALLRWHHPERGAISPAEFIPIAEETRLILPIGRWVIDEACRVAAEWPEEIGIAVNLSARQFADPLLLPGITTSLRRHGVAAGRLTLEITESALIRDDGAARAMLDEMRALGMRTALDDFGTGYASLSYLTRFPFDVIKIDQSFVRGSGPRSNDATIIETICDLARRLDLVIVAEGVETEEQLAMLRAAGCDKGQGYLFDRPLGEAASAARLAAERLKATRTALHASASDQRQGTAGR